ncbi:MAG: hypothetical protein O9256_01735 [Rhizobiaceae bacterium]|nr:hypothetical protein [Rhizobiaceae bacterium]MCZ8352875.1 hypothetical protein [Rhizobium sp.]
MVMRGLGCMFVSAALLGTPAKANDLAAAYEALYSSITGGSILVKCGASTLRVSRGLIAGMTVEMMNTKTGKWDEKVVTAHTESRITFGGLYLSADTEAAPFTEALSEAIAGRPYDGGFGMSYNYRPKRKDYPITAEAVIDFFAGTIKVRTTEGASVVWDFDGLKEWEVVTTVPSGTVFQELACNIRV